MVLQCILLVVGFILLVKGADFFVEGAVGIAQKFGIPQIIIGLTVVAMGTSAPEAAVSIAAAAGGNADITIGNIVGSNIMNILVILGVTAVITSIAVSKTTLKHELPFMIIVSGIFLIMGLDGKIGIIDAIILVAMLVAYMYYLIRSAKKGGTEDIPPGHRKLGIPLTLFLTGIGIAMIIIGSRISVNAATYIAKFFGVSDRFIGLTVVAFGTSLPELFTSVTAAKKGNADIAIGNVVGSNIFNILFVVGVSGLITRIPFAGSFILDSIIAIAASAALLLFCLKDKRLYRWGGIIFLIGYAFYFAFVLL